MYDVQYHPLGMHAVEQRAVSQQAARNAEFMQAVREQRMARKAQRKAHRSARTSQESYTTAV